MPLNYPEEHPSLKGLDKMIQEGPEADMQPMM